MRYRNTAGRQTWVFADLRELMAKATPLRSGDELAGVAASCAEEPWRPRCAWPTCRSRPS